MRIHRSTTIFSVATLILLICLGIVLQHLLPSRVRGALPQVQGSQQELAVPYGLSSATKGETTFDAKSALIWNTATQEIELQYNGFEPRPVASLTKLMTAMVALDRGIDWDKAASIELQEYVVGGRLLLHPGEKVTMRDLFYASLLGSANNATLAYVRMLGMEEETFVEAMNRKAIDIGLEQTHFVEVTGLDSKNVSTAYEIARLAAYAFAHYPDIRHASSAPEYTFTVLGSGRERTLKNTNKLIVDKGLLADGSKTGYLDEAGYCLVMQEGNRIGVVLGSSSEQSNFADMQRLFSNPS